MEVYHQFFINGAEVRNCYNYGNVEAEKNNAGGIASYVGNTNDTGTGNIYNCYYLSSSCSKGYFYKYGSITIEITECDDTKMKNLLSSLNTNGSTIWKDPSSTNMNNGYPILYWQK